MNYKDILTNLQENIPFQFARVGDGEILCMDGANGKNADGHKYFVELGRLLREVYGTKKTYAVGLHPVKHGLHSDANKYPQSWVNADVLHDASIEGDLKRFFKALRSRKVVMVGNSLHGKLPFIDALIEVPKIDAFQALPHTWMTIDKMARKDKDLVFLFSCGMMKGILIDLLFGKYPNQTAIDTGSLFEPYLGKSTRKYHKKILERENS